MLPPAMAESDRSHVRNLLVDHLASQHFAIIPNFLHGDQIEELRLESNDRFRSNDFRKARIGKTGHASHQSTIRNDKICWLEEEAHRPRERTFFGELESLRLLLNAQLFLGLKNVEAHYARYEVGDFYRRHLDRFQTDDARMISLVLFLNSGWTESDGGHLRLYPPGSSPVDVSPMGGTLVCFTSSEIEHEVLPSPTRERLSIAAWYRR